MKKIMLFVNNAYGCKFNESHSIYGLLMELANILKCYYSNLRSLSNLRNYFFRRLKMRKNTKVERFLFYEFLCRLKVGI